MNCTISWLLSIFEGQRGSQDQSPPCILIEGFRCIASLRSGIGQSCQFKSRGSERAGCIARICQKRTGTVGCLRIIRSTGEGFADNFSTVDNLSTVDNSSTVADNFPAHN
jgi:hypothetical protein